MVNNIALIRSIHVDAFWLIPEFTRSRHLYLYVAHLCLYVAAFVSLCGPFVSLGPSNLIIVTFNFMFGGEPKKKKTTPPLPLQAII